MTKKMKKQGGFTLVEMLIVVAIIAILIAVSIPLVSGSLEKAREATDAANERSFKAALTIGYLTRELDSTTAFVNGTVYGYNAAEGKLVDGAIANGYGQGTAAAGKDQSADKTDQVLYGYVDADGNVFIGWSAKGSSKPDKTAIKNENLTSDALLKTT